ncbi:hypothetical protein LI82_02295 [Methanococcoides methylutens]|uniref:Uncharacterized protein n=1 Tax=Methanococcoides methylutens TaxID=2226 RepID=A0A099T3D2_METMT|nr:hypothetical protein [Methanococcoides methylutens]KGK99592.1 hypothetical protein LI82_02295 [Methanococcoides methylutens]
MKAEKKEYNVARQEYLEITRRNRKIAKIDMLILGTGLLLKYADQAGIYAGGAEIGKHFMWLGFIIIVYVFGSNMMAKSELGKAQP